MIPELQSSGVAQSAAAGSCVIDAAAVSILVTMFTGRVRISTFVVSVASTVVRDHYIIALHNGRLSASPQKSASFQSKVTPDASVCAAVL